MQNIEIYSQLIYVEQSMTLNTCCLNMYDFIFERRKTDGEKFRYKFGSWCDFNFSASNHDG